jgi:DNA polymerase (family 10)
MSDANRDAAEMLRELHDLVVLEEGDKTSFRARAYESAIRAVEAHGGDLSAMDVAALQRIDGIGKSTAQSVHELFTTGRVAKLEALRARFPAGVVALLRVPGVGPKGAVRLQREAAVASLDDLKRAVAEQRIRGLRGFGAKTEERLAEVLARMERDGTDRRTPISVALPLARRIESAIRAAPGVRSVTSCGSLRRFRETVGELPIVVAGGERGAVLDAALSLPMVERVTARGDAEASFVTRRGLGVQVRIVPDAEHGAALLAATGSARHLAALADRAAARGLSLDAAGLRRASGAVVAAETEEAIYAALGLPRVPPELREGAGELDAAERGELPRALTAEEMIGDFHVHTDLSGDGQVALEEIVTAAQGRGYTVLAITEHAEGLSFNGVGREAMLAQRERLRALEARLGGLRLLHGVELNIGPRGELDYDLAFRRGFDFCLASIHDHFDLDRATQTARVIAAMRDPTVDMIGHLSARMIGARPGVELDVGAVLEAAAETGTAIEVNGGLPRLDASTDVLRAARGRDVTFFLTSDAHRAVELERVDHGRRHALRGWLDPGRVANAWPRERLLAWIAGRRARAAA